MREKHKLSQFWHPRYWGVWAMICCLYVIARCPYRLQMAIGASLGYGMYRLMPTRRHFAEVNIALCFPELSEAEQANLVRRHFDSFGKATVETAMAWWTPYWQLRHRVEVLGLEHLHAAQKNGQGVLLLSAHFTTLELGGRLLALTQPFQVSYKAHKKKPLFNEIMMRARERRFEQAISSKHPRDMIKSLKTGKILWYAPDQDFGRKQSVFAPFFGIPAITLISTARIVKMTKAQVVPFYAQRLDNGKGYRLIIEPALSDFPVGDDVTDATTINTLIEGWVRQAPEQYLWVHRRFKTRPEGEEKFYRPKKKKKKVARGLEK